MIQLSDIKKVFFLGIGGIGMSAIARYFASRQIAVGGYDRTATPLTKALEEGGIAVTYEENPGALPRDVQLVVYTPAIPKESSLIRYYTENGYPVLKRSEVLELISNSSFNICIGGTHGKTTITTMIAHILRHSGYGCNAFLGGISTNYNTNFWSSPRNICVIEADEYDRSFLKLRPDIAIISSMDADHLDIYGTETALQDAFINFSGRVKPGGLLLSRFGLKRSREMQASNHSSYSLQNESADAYAANIRIMNGSYQFDVMMQDTMLDNVVLNMGGMHNVENVVAAIAIARHLAIDNDKIKAAVEGFKGVKRRFEYIVKKDVAPQAGKGIIFIDDYAHHPEELRALITGASTLFKGRKLTIIFQPHLFSRTNDLAEAFAESLDLADAVILLPIYAARELPVPGVSSQLILGHIKIENKRLMEKEELLRFINEKYIPGQDNDFGELLITAGAGDIDALVEPIKQSILAS